MILSGYPSDTLRVSWDFFILKKRKRKTIMSIAKKKNVMSSKVGIMLFLKMPNVVLWLLKKQLHPTCKHVDLMSLICGKKNLFAA
jgi:hypothetical protein